MLLNAGTQKLINELYNKREHVELTIGILQNGEKEVIHWGPHREIKDEELIYPVGSICKPFTASWAAKLIAEGKMDLDQPINAYITDLPEQYYPPLRRLTTHTSGYSTQPYNLLTTIPFFVKMNHEGGLFHTNPFRGYPDEAGMKKILAGTHLKDKEYKFEYSNIGMSVFGYITGKVSGEGFWDGMNRYVREDLGLEHTFLGNVDLLGYDRKDQPCRCWQWHPEDIIAPAGALNSTMSDLLTFTQKNMDGSLPYLDLCHEVNGSIDQDNDSGLAWRLYKKQPIRWHTGSAGAFSCWLGMNRETKNAVAVGINYGLVNAEEIGFSILTEM